MMKKLWGRMSTCVFLMMMGTLLLFGCGDSKSECVVRFNTCTNLETNKVKDRTVSVGEKVSRPNIYVSDSEYSNYIIKGWYADEAYTTEWDFDTNTVQEDTVLYAKWEKQYFVRYFQSNTKEPKLGVYVSEGEYAQKHDELGVGYEILGYYADPGYTVLYDFEQPITKDTDIYMRLSESIYWDGVSIKDNYIVEVATGENSTAGEIKLVEDEDETYVEVDFGYSEYRDPRIQTHGMFDMTKSQLLTITYKNLGSADALAVFWLVQYEDGLYSGPNGEYLLQSNVKIPIKSEMSPEDDWETVTIDMGALAKENGESQWAEGKILHVFRVDSLYAEGDDEEFVPNIIQFKEISFKEGEKYITTDSVQLETTDIFEVINAADKQEAITNGFVFPKDRIYSIPKQGTLQYNRLDAATYFFPYGGKLGVVSYDCNLLKINLEENPLLFLKYKNEGHSNKLTIRYTTTDGVVGEKEVEIKSEMSTYSTLLVNMINEKEWKGTLASLDLIYHKVGTDNILSVQSIYMQPFVASDIAGINFNDTKCAGFVTNDTYEIIYDSKSEASYVEMLQDSVTFKKNVSINTNMFGELEFTYSVATKGVESITLSYQIDGQWYSNVIDDVKRTAGFVTVSFPLEKQGEVTALSIELNGKGKISIRSMEFKVNQDFALDFSDGKYVKDHFMAEWGEHYGVDYDVLKNAAVLTNDGTPSGRCMFYLGASGYRENINLSSTDKKIYVYYSNPGEARSITLDVFYANSDNKTGSGIVGNDPAVSENKSVAMTTMIRGNMASDEWAVAVFDFSGTDLFSADRNATMLSFTPGGDMYIRAIVLQ